MLSQAGQEQVNHFPQMIIETSKGNITVEVFDDKAPVSAANFRRYAKEKFYDGLIFHRVIPNFMIQGGGFKPGMIKKNPSHRPIVNEADNGLKNKRYTLAMARTNDINSATSQFFINVKDNTFLDHQKKTMRQYGYAVFGKVTDGMDVVDAIAATPTGSKGHYGDVPRQDVVIIRMYEKISSN
jgi:cyclophilin family peptidyl-prolyl cis-trans isomerase